MHMSKLKPETVERNSSSTIVPPTGIELNSSRISHITQGFEDAGLERVKHVSQTN